jgi:methionine synthase II (cobalamin-independent)
VSGAASDQNCGFFQLPHWLTVRKRQRMVAGAQIVRHELAG